MWTGRAGSCCAEAGAVQAIRPRPAAARQAPIQGKVFGVFPLADLVIYHLRMIRREDREARRERYQRLDPEARWQPTVGYAYLTDERGLKLRRVPHGRRYED